MSWWWKRRPKDTSGLGRNDPCWCGSGKKYKKCHMATDARKQAGKVTLTCAGPS